MAAILLFVLALASLAGSVLMLKVGLSERARGRELASASRLDAAELRRSPEGRRGYVEGRLADSNPELAHGLVLYTRSTLYGHRRDDDGRERPIWKTRERRWPHLRVELEDGAVVQVEEGYGVTLLGSDPSIVPPEKNEAGETERFDGLGRGQPVCAVGTVASGGEEPVLSATGLFSGTFEDARSGAASASTFGLIVGAVLLVAGILLGIVGFTVI